MIQATEDRICVKVQYQERYGSILLPDQSKKYNGPFYGEIISIGPDYPYKEIKPGDKLVFRRHEGFPITVGDEDYLVLRERWCEGLLNGELDKEVNVW